MVRDPLSVTLTLSPCSGQSVVTLVLSFYPSPLSPHGWPSSTFFVPFLLASPASLRSHHIWDDFIELLNAYQLLPMLQVLQLFPVLWLLYTLRHPGHHPILKMSGAQNRTHQQNERDWGGRWVRWKEQRLGVWGDETITSISISTAAPTTQAASWLSNHLNAQRPTSPCSKRSPSWVSRLCLWTSGRIPQHLLGSLL